MISVPIDGAEGLALGKIYEGRDRLIHLKIYIDLAKPNWKTTCNMTIKEEGNFSAVAIHGKNVYGWLTGEADKVCKFKVEKNKKNLELSKHHQTWLNHKLGYNGDYPMVVQSLKDLRSKTFLTISDVSDLET